MARWKARVEFLLMWLDFFSYLLRLRRYKAKGVKTRCYQEGLGQFERRFQGEGVVPGEYFLVSAKLDTFCYPTVQTAPYYVPSFWHNTGVWRTDGRQTDGIAVASTPLAKRRAVITDQEYLIEESHSLTLTQHVKPGGKLNTNHIHGFLLHRTS